MVEASKMELADPKIDRQLRTAIEQKRLIRFNYKGKPRIVEPHDYGVHKGLIKLFGYQVGGLSSEPLPNWRWALVNSISDPCLLDQRFPGRRPSPSGRHHQWDQIFARVGTPEQAWPAAEACGSSSLSQCGKTNDSRKHKTASSAQIRWARE
jgi:hypothetical protein